MLPLTSVLALLPLLSVVCGQDKVVESSASAKSAVEKSSTDFAKAAAPAAPAAAAAAAVQQPAQQQAVQQPAPAQPPTLFGLPLFPAALFTTPAPVGVSVTAAVTMSPIATLLTAPGRQASEMIVRNFDSLKRYCPNLKNLLNAATGATRIDQIAVDGHKAQVQNLAAQASASTNPVGGAVGVGIGATGSLFGTGADLFGAAQDGFARSLNLAGTAYETECVRIYQTLVDSIRGINDALYQVAGQPTDIGVGANVKTNV